MLKVVTAREMQGIDKVTIKRYGIPGTILMERAGLAVVSRINELFPGKKVVVLCGGGNNGGDGLVIARMLRNEGRNVSVFLVANPEHLMGDESS
jgi:NAD(P)H-hydrate epimerase